MTPLAVFSLMLFMLALAAMPSASVALVVTRSAALGFCNGAAVALGIVIGDLVFVAFAIFGMSVLAETMGAFFAVVKFAGGAYLIWLGIDLLRADKEATPQFADSRKSTLFASFLSGLVLTLGDVKAILFYASLFPAFVNMATLSAVNIGAIVVVTILSVGGVKLAYAFAARRIVRRLRSNKAQKTLRTATGGIMMGAGTYLIAKA